MPKDVSERIIDWPYVSAGSRGGSVSIGGGGGGGGGGATNLDALTDVTLSAPANGQTLSYNSGSGQWVNAAPAAMASHGLSSSYHTGALNWSLINFTPSDMADISTRRHVDLQGIGPNDHHFQAHVLATGTALGADHTISGAAAGEVLRALSATTAAFDVLQHTDLGNILPDQHHTRVHDIISGDGSGAVHTIAGSQFQVVGATATNVLGLLTPSFAPGAAAAILRTDANGAIQLDTNLFYVDGANNWIGINRTPSGATLDLIASANADHTQRIKQKSGQTARLWRIEDTSGNELIVLDSVGNLQSGQPGFVSGLLGWQITPQGNAEFNNIWARGELHATVFVKDEVHATGGTLLVATAGTLHDDAVISSATVDDDVLVLYSTPAGQGVPLQVVTTSGTFVGTELHVSWLGNFINVNDPPSGPGFYFQPGDIVRSKTEVPTGVTDFWLEINSATQNSGYSTYSVFKRSGTDGTLPKGSALVSYGREGDGRILMTSDLNYAPYIDVFTTGPNVWTGAAGSVIPRMRMGRLDGIGLPGVSGVTQYGMIAGKDLSDANSGYLIASNLQFSLYKVDIRLNNGVSDTGLWTADGNLKIGSNVGAAATTGFSVFTTGGRSGDVVIGNEATGNYLRWQQSTGILQVSGSLIVSDPGTTVTKTYVDNQDAYFDNLAGGTYTSNGVLGGYAVQAQTNAQSYADARRIVSVTGSWDTNGATQIIWGTKVAGGAALSAAFGNGTSRTIADHAGTFVTVSTRTYLYVSVAGSGTMTMLTTTSHSVVAGSPNYVLIAVAEPGRNGAQKASVSIVAGSTYISGGNIWTGSITASQIQALTITGNEIVGGSITADKLHAATLTTTYLDPVSNAAAADATTKANNAQTNATNAAATDATTKANNAGTDAQDYSENRRVVAVSGTWAALDANTITWSSLQVKFANQTSRTISPSAVAPTGYTLTPAGRHYLYITVTDATPSFGDTTTLSTLTANHALIAVVDTGVVGTTPKASINVVAGSTYISGDNIMTGTIVANRIATGTITANELAADSVTAVKINVTNLQAVSTATGALSVTGNIDIGTTGAIRGNAKAYGSITPGFFLGYSGGYKFDVGNDTNYMRWTGTQLLLKTEWALEMGTDFNGAAIIITNPVSQRQGFVTYDNGGNHAFNFTDAVWAGSFLATGPVEGTQLRALVPSGNSGTVLYFQVAGGSDTFTYDRSGSPSLLTYSGAMRVNGSLNAIGQLITNSNTMNIATAKTPQNAGAAGNIGDICWDANRLYVCTAGGWRYLPLQIMN